MIGRTLECSPLPVVRRVGDGWKGSLSVKNHIARFVPFLVCLSIGVNLGSKPLKSPAFHPVSPQLQRIEAPLHSRSDEIMESLFPGSEWADSKALAKFDRREVIQVLTQAQKDAYGTRANGMAENQPPVFGMTR